MKFGSAELHLALQAACDAGDLSRAAELLYEPVCTVSRFLFVKYRETFGMYSLQDREDAVSDALLYMLDRLDRIAHPEQEGTPKASFYYQYIYNGLRQRRHRIIRESKQASLDAPVTRSGSQGDDRIRTFGETLPAPAPLPGEALETQDALHHALKAFFSLSNDPETLVSIAFIILNEQVGLKPMSMREYVEFLNGQPVSKVLHSIETILIHLRQDTSVLAPLKKRLSSSGPALVFAGLTESKLANRKNSILSKLRPLKKEDSKKKDDRKKDE